MKKLLSLLLAFALFLPAAVANQSAGFMPDPAKNGDPDASYITLGTSTILNNERVLSPTARFAITDNGPGGTYVLDLATIGAGYGGGGGTTYQASFNNLANGTAGASAASGDMLYRGVTNWSRLAKGSDGQYLQLSSGLPVWATPPTGPDANAQFIVSASDVTIPNADVLTQGDGITVTNGTNTSTVAVNSSVARLAAVQSLSSKTLVLPAFAWDSGNGLVLKGSANDAALTWADWVGAKDLRIPDPGSTSPTQFLLNRGNQTINGVLTFTGVPVISQITNGGGTLTLPSSTDTLVGRNTSDTFTNKIYDAPVIASASSITLKQSTADYTITWNNPSGARAYKNEDVGTSPAAYAMKADGDAYTNNGAAYANGNVIKFTSAGSSGQPLLAGSPPAFGTLGNGGGGTGITSYTAGDILVANDSGVLVKLAGGSNNDVLTYDSTGNPNVKWAAGGGGSGTVTSVGITGPSIISWTNTPVTSSGTLTGTLANQNANLVLAGPVYAGSAAAPTFRNLDGLDIFGGANNSRPAPTSGTLTGEYWTSGNWTTTNTITCNRCRLHFGGTVTISHAITVNTELPGGHGADSTGQPFGGAGHGLGGGTWFFGSFDGGSGGSFGGLGGVGSIPTTGGSKLWLETGTYSIDHALYGSSGSGGSASNGVGGTGGGGGGGIYIEAKGNVTIDANITGAGGAGGNGTGTNASGGGGGTGMACDIRSLGTVTVNSTRVVSAAGGAGGNGLGTMGGGGGGGGGHIRMRGSTVTNNGTVSAGAGSAGTNGGGFSGTSAVAGATGVVDLASEVVGPRSAN